MSKTSPIGALESSHFQQPGGHLFFGGEGFVCFGSRGFSGFCMVFVEFCIVLLFLFSCVAFVVLCGAIFGFCGSFGGTP